MASVRPRLYPLARALLFRLDPERAHAAALGLAAWLEPLAARTASGRTPDPRLRRRLLGLDFPTPIGLAAGFDKDGRAPHVWEALGFGFAEIGTVTGRPQPGNPRPRLARFAADRALVNRLGFNSEGADAVASRLERLLERRPTIPIGINLGASRAAVGDRAAERADYRLSVRRLAPLADYLAVNVSSPNTPGLRELQRPESLRVLLADLRSALAGLAGPAAGRPLLVKLSPDLGDAEIEEVCRAGLEGGAAGFIATNTTLARPAGRPRLAAEAGGLSGAPLRARSTEVVRRVRRAVGLEVPVIGVGGVLRAEDAIEKLRAGADLVQIYSALIFEGPWIARRIALELACAVRRSGAPDVEAFVRDLARERTGGP